MEGQTVVGKLMPSGQPVMTDGTMNKWGKRTLFVVTSDGRKAWLKAFAGQQVVLFDGTAPWVIGAKSGGGGGSGGKASGNAQGYVNEKPNDYKGIAKGGPLQPKGLDDKMALSFFAGCLYYTFSPELDNEGNADLSNVLAADYITPDDMWRDVSYKLNLAQADDSYAGACKAWFDAAKRINYKQFLVTVKGVCAVVLQAINLGRLVSILFGLNKSSTVGASLLTSMLQVLNLGSAPPPKAPPVP